MFTQKVPAQIAQEGAIQIFKVPFAGMEEVIVGVVGTLQFDVFQYRMRSEYGVELRMAGLPYDHLRVDLPAVGVPVQGRGGHAEKFLQERLHAEVGQGGSSTPDSFPLATR